MSVETEDPKEQDRTVEIAYAGGEPLGVMLFVPIEKLVDAGIDPQDGDVRVRWRDGVLKME